MKCLHRHGLPPCCDLHCGFDLLCTKAGSSRVSIGCLQVYQTPILSVHRCAPCQMHRGQTAIGMICVFYITTFQALPIPSCKATWAYLWSSLPVFCYHSICLANLLVLTHFFQQWAQGFSDSFTKLALLIHCLLSPGPAFSVKGLRERNNKRLSPLRRPNLITALVPL